MTPTYVAYLRDSGGEDQDLSVEQQETAIPSTCIANIYRPRLLNRSVFENPGKIINSNDLGEK